MAFSAFSSFSRSSFLRISTLAVLLSLGASAQSSGGESHGARGHAHGVPEIDPTLAGAGIVLLVGGALVLTSRRRAATAPKS